MVTDLRLVALQRKVTVGAEVKTVVVDKELGVVGLEINFIQGNGEQRKPVVLLPQQILPLCVDLMGWLHAIMNGAMGNGSNIGNPGEPSPESAGETVQPTD